MEEEKRRQTIMLCSLPLALGSAIASFLLPSPSFVCVVV